MDFDLSLIGWALQSGIFAFLNPCGFAMLPSYVSHYLRSESSVQATQSQHGFVSRGLLGLKLGLVVSAGFFTVFIIMGLAVAGISSAVGSYLPWVAAFVGLLLVLIGARLLFSPEATIPFTAMAGRVYALSRNRSRFLFYYFYGIGYAIASCGCTLSIFLAVVLQSLSAGIAGIFSFLAYAFGMTLLMLLLSLGLAFTKGGMDRALPLKWALAGLIISTFVLVYISWQNDWGSVTAYENNQFLLMILAPALVLSLFFQLKHWELATRVLNSFILVFAGAFMIYYQLIYSGIVRF
jgi:cytochrome c biogenesis protein CcdA